MFLFTAKLKNAKKRKKLATQLKLSNTQTRKSEKTRRSVFVDTKKQKKPKKRQPGYAT